MLETEFTEGDGDDEVTPQEPYQQPAKKIKVE
jgi:hypothetical protein